jgi:fermentation-respiration switch protein FrsA (DUF1100 family)
MDAWPEYHMQEEPMRWTKVILGIVVGLVIVALVGMAIVSRAEGHKMVLYPLEERDRIVETPADHDLPFEDVTVTTTDGLKLVGWYVPSQNGAAVMALHGFKSDRQSLLLEAELLHRNGYGVLLTTTRGHDLSEGELITWGRDEMDDLDAWYHYLLSRDDVDPDKIGIIGESFGALLSIKYGAENEEIKAVVAHGAFSSLEDSVEIGIVHYTDLPVFPFAPLIVFWAERRADMDASEVDATVWIKEISPRGVLILHGGRDDYVAPDSGQHLFDAAGEPKELWFEPEAVHTGFDDPNVVPAEEYEKRLVGFFDRYLEPVAGYSSP